MWLINCMLKICKLLSEVTHLTWVSTSNVVHYKSHKGESVDGLIKRQQYYLNPNPYLQGKQVMMFRCNAIYGAGIQNHDLQNMSLLP